MLPAQQGASTGRNHPLAPRMGVIAFLNQNITIGCVFGSFSVLLTAVEAHLGIDRKLSVLGVPALNLAIAICAPLSGILAARYSLRLTMLAGALLSSAGYVLLALTHTYALYLIAFGLLLGPGMASVGVVLPATLVTRWFTVNRGRALGLVTIPLVITCLPLTATWTLHSLGLAATYWILAGLSLLCVLANLFIIDRPPGSEPAPPADTRDSPPPAAPGESGLLQLLFSLRFWALALPAISPITGAVILAAHLVPMAQSWGLTPALGATLLSVQSLVGIPGTVIFGWIADRIGSVFTLALLVFDCGILWLLLLLQPPFAATAALIGLFGLHCAGSLPVTGAVLSEVYGREKFSRVYGVFNLVNLPFSVGCVPAAALVLEHTGSYSVAIISQVVFFALGALLALCVHRRRQHRPPESRAGRPGIVCRLLASGKNIVKRC